MARARRTSQVLETARQRLAGLKSITPAPDYGPGLTLTDYGADISTLSGKLDNYNQKLAELDELLNDLEAFELTVRDKNKRMLSGTEAKYGPDSSEYEQVGGTRTSERKKPKAKGSGGGGTPPTP